ncbi:cellulase family glycosylhydrolase [Niveibacterium umoris]|uniref:Glycoside hydrolase family 5 domain-containing protein n=1 Tax=Niveibacterium umoris TaxID=1193620 RepID=A0A840BDK1_9RHOO|nr:cellulase family glycosylhydrolase [Niveibacterium umoris]MBB4011601.1 hypothetical protein [Niveibacterium umoris]
MLLGKLTLLSWLVASSCVVASEQFKIGVSIHFGTNWDSYGDVFPSIQNLGFNSFRDEVFWHRLESTVGTREFPASLADLNRAVDNSKRLNVIPLIILNYGNKAFQDGDLPTTDVAIEAFTKYALFVDRYFGDKVSSYEVWNEWNIGLGSPRRPRTLGRPDDYVRLLKSVSQALRRERTSVEIVAGAIEGLDDRWVDGFISSGGLSWSDAISVHPYVLQKARNNLPETSIEWLDMLHKKVAAASPGRAMPVYVTEIGWPTNRGQYGVAEDEAAAYYARYVLLARARDWVKGVWWYTLLDSGNDESNKEHRFGIVRRDGGYKPMGYVAKYINPLLNSASFKELNIGSGVRGVIVEEKRRTRCFVWAERKIDEPKVTIDAGKIAAATGFVMGRPGSISEIAVGGSPIEIVEDSGVWKVRSVVELARLVTKDAK